MPQAASSSSPARWLTPGIILAVFAGLSPAIIVFAERGMAALYPAAAVLLVAVHRLNTGRWPKPHPMLLWPLLALTVWGALSAAWSLDALLSLRRAAILAGLFTLFTAAAGCTDGLDAAERDRINRWLLGGLTLALALMLEEQWSGFPLHHLRRRLPMEVPVPGFVLNRPALTLVLLCWPSVLWAAVRGHRRAAVLMPVAVMLLLLNFDGDTAKMAMAASLLAATLAWISRHHAGRFFAVALAAGALAMPALMLWADNLSVLAFKPSAAHRLQIWEFTARRIVEKPFLGWGLDTARVMPNFGETPMVGATVIPLHPHNAVLQLWLETGMVGLALALSPVLWMALRSGTSPARAALLGTLTAAAAGSLTGYGLWQEWWLCTMAAQGLLAAALFKR